MTLLFVVLRCRVFGHAVQHFSGTFYLACTRSGCGAVGRIA